LKAGRASLEGDDFERWCVAPMAAIIKGLRARGVNVPIIAFPRAAKTHMGDYCAVVQCDALGLDTSADIDAVRDQVGDDMVLQGNLDPQGFGSRVARRLTVAVREILAKTKNTPHIFNLGHGIVPQTPPENVTRLIELIRGAPA
jgi:uroporphyrinogen decarboxylase